MDRPSVARDEHLEYLNRVGSEYRPHRHQTIVAHMVKRFAVAASDVEAVVQYWLATRRA